MSGAFPTLAQNEHQFILKALQQTGWKLRGPGKAAELLDIHPSLVDAAFIDPDWAVTGPDHVYHFIYSNTQPPADTLLNEIIEIARNVAIVLPPHIDVQEFKNLPKHEREKLYLGESHELFCLYFGELMTAFGETKFRVPI